MQNNPNREEGKCRITRIEQKGSAELPESRKREVQNYPNLEEGKCRITRIEKKGSAE